MSRADISGHATPGSSVIIGDEQYDVDATTGAWKATLTNLLPGVNDFNVEQWQDGTKKSERSLSIDLSITELTNITAAFNQVDPLQEAIVSGKGEPGAEVSILDKRGIVTKTTADASTGDFSTPVPAPGVGAQTFSVSQKLGDVTAQPKTTSLTYGAPINVTEPADDIDLEGASSVTFKGNKAVQGDKVEVFEGDTQVGETTTVIGNNTWKVFVGGITNSEHTYTAKQTSKGNLTTEKEITVNPGQSDVTQPTAVVTFDADVTKTATIGGAGENGAQIVVKVDDRTIGQPTTVTGGTWSLDIGGSLSAGNHTFTVEQTIDGKPAGSTTVTKDFGAAVEATGPTQTFAGSSTNVTGTGANGAKILVSEGGKQVGTATVANGVWSAPVDQIQDGRHTYEITQTAAGKTVSLDSINIERNATRANVTLTAPKDGDTYSGTSVTFTGKGTPGAAIEITPTNYAGAVVKATVKWDGTWTANRSMGTGPYVFDITQTAKGSSDHIRDIHLAQAGQGISKPFALTSPTATSTPIVGGIETFTGNGTYGQTVTLSPTNYAGAVLTTTVKSDGTWEIKRSMGAGPYVFDVVQTDGTKVTGEVRDFYYGTSASYTFQMTSPVAGGNPIIGGTETFTGRGHAGNTVTITPTNYAGAVVSTTVKNDGTWSVSRGMGTGPYVFDIVETNSTGNTTGEVRDFYYGPQTVDLPFEMTSPKAGDTYTAGVNTVFTGKGATGNTITLTPTNYNGAVTTATVKADGSWTINRILGTGPYVFDIVETKDGTQVGKITGFTYSAK